MYQNRPLNYSGKRVDSNATDICWTYKMNVTPTPGYRLFCWFLRLLDLVLLFDEQSCTITKSFGWSLHDRRDARKEIRSQKWDGRALQCCVRCIPRWGGRDAGKWHLEREIMGISTQFSSNKLRNPEMGRKQTLWFDQKTSIGALATAVFIVCSFGNHSSRSDPAKGEK